MKKIYNYWTVSKLLTNQTTQKKIIKRKACVWVHTGGGGGGGGAAGCTIELGTAPFCITSASWPNIP